MTTLNRCWTFTDDDLALPVPRRRAKSDPVCITQTLCIEWLLRDIPETYLIFVALQCLAVPLAYFLTRPEKVQRSDGSKVKVIAQDSWRAEFVELWRVSARKEVRGRVTRMPLNRSLSKLIFRSYCYCRCSGRLTSISILGVSPDEISPL